MKSQERKRERGRYFHTHANTTPTSRLQASRLPSLHAPKTQSLKAPKPPSPHASNSASHQASKPPCLAQNTPRDSLPNRHAIKPPASRPKPQLRCTSKPPSLQASEPQDASAGSAKRKQFTGQFTFGVRGLACVVLLNTSDCHVAARGPQHVFWNSDRT